MNNLEEILRKYETVNRDRCPDCGNPWWFALEDGYSCTTCGMWNKRAENDSYVPKEQK